MADKINATQFTGANKHVVLPVVHPSGEVHDIAFPEGTPLQEVHSALLDQYAHPQPDAAGAFENSSAFKQAASRAWKLIDNGKKHAESGEVFVPSSNKGVHGLSVGVYPDEGGKGGVPFNPPADSPYLLHTHNNSLQGDPSKGDIENTKKWNQKRGMGRTMYMVSRDGLYSIDGTGVVTKVFSGTDWMNK